MQRDENTITLFTCSSTDGTLLPPHSGWEPTNEVGNEGNISVPKVICEAQTASRSHKLVKATRKKSAASVDASMQRKAKARRQRRMDREGEKKSRPAQRKGEPEDTAKAPTGTRRKKRRPSSINVKLATRRRRMLSRVKR